MFSSTNCFFEKVALFALAGHTLAFPAIPNESTEDESVESPKDLDVRQGYNNYPGSLPVGGYPGGPVGGNYPINQPGNFPGIQNNFPHGSLPLPGQLGGDVPPHPLNSRPSYAYDSAYPDEVNFSLADPHRNVAAAIQAAGFPQPALGGATELLPTGYQGKPLGAGIPAAVSASAAVIKTPLAF